MKIPFLKTSVVAALGALSMAAVAAPVLLDFEALGNQARNSRAPVSVGNVSGFNISGAFAYHFDMLSDADNKPKDTNKGGFLINRSRAADTASIIVSLNEPGVPAARQYVKEISLQMFTLADKPLVIASNADGSKMRTIELSPSDGTKFWSLNGPYLFDVLDMFTRVEFRSDGAVLGIDDLSITLSEAGNNGGGGGGGNVPEPASFALVGLALLAAGTAKRRRA